LGFTSLKASGTSVQKDNKLSAQSWLHLQEDRSVSSWEQLCSARFWYLISQVFKHWRQVLKKFKSQ
jgi:hypothetical protein